MIHLGPLCSTHNPHVAYTFPPPPMISMHPSGPHREAPYLKKIKKPVPTRIHIAQEFLLEYNMYLYT